MLDKTFVCLLKHVAFIMVIICAAQCPAGPALVIPAPTETDGPPTSSTLLNPWYNNHTISEADWQIFRTQLRSQWMSILGPLPQAPNKPTKPKLLKDESLTTCIRQIIEYESEPGRLVKAYLLRPRDASPTTRPAVVVFHPTTTETMHVVAGTGGRPEQHVGLKLVEHGFIVLSPANYLWEEPTWLKSVASAKARHPDSTGMATMLADAHRAVDVISSIQGVDKDRIVTLGHSLGAKEVLYLMAFDDRVKAGVFSEGGIALPFSNWDAPWYLGDQIKDRTFHHEHDELIALISPRSFLLFGGEIDKAADGNKSLPYIKAGNLINQNRGVKPSFALINHGDGHKFYSPMVDEACKWLEQQVVP